MRTATIEQVLGPVAQLVAEFLLTLDNDERLVLAADSFVTNGAIVAESVNGLLDAVNTIVSSSKVSATAHAHARAVSHAAPRTHSPT